MTGDKEENTSAKKDLPNSERVKLEDKGDIILKMQHVTNMRHSRKYFREKSPTVTMTMTGQTGSATKITAEIKLYTCAIIFR